MQIEVDFDVWRELTARRQSENDTYSDVIRRLLGQDGEAAQVAAPSQNGKAWYPKGVKVPEGTLFRTTYQGQEHTGRVEDGALVVNGESFRSPSAAGSSITGYSVNGWIFWECQLPGTEKWVTLDSIRRQ